MTVARREGGHAGECGRTGKQVGTTRQGREKTSRTVTVRAEREVAHASNPCDPVPP